MKNILLVGVPFESWELVIKNMLSLGHKVYVIGWKHDSLFWNKYDISFIELDSLWKLEVQTDIINNSIQWSLSHSSDFIQLLAMFDRLESNLTSINYSTRESISFLELNKWYTFLKLNSIDNVIISNIPHRVWDFCIYLASKELKIKQTIFGLTPFKSNVLVYDCLRSKPLKFKDDYFLETGIFEEFYKKVRGLKNSSIPSYMIKQKSDNKFILGTVFMKYIDKLSRFNLSRVKEIYHPNTYRWLSKRYYSYKKPSWLNHIFDGILKYIFLKRLKNNYNSLALNALPKDDFYFFALHYQPEETTLPSALNYHNQFSLVEYIDSTLPKNTKLVIKEHPSQFYFSMEGDSGRDLNYYNRIKKISNRIHIQSMKTSSFDILRESKGVFTITGTIGVEAAITNKKVFSFGRIWYNGLKNIYNIRSCNIQDFYTINSVEFTDSDWEYFSNIINKNLLSCKPYKPHVSYNDISNNKSSKNLIKFLKNEVLI